jgi:hypothetical protein
MRVSLSMVNVMKHLKHQETPFEIHKRRIKCKLKAEIRVTIE